MRPTRQTGSAKPKGPNYLGLLLVRLGFSASGVFQKDIGRVGRDHDWPCGTHGYVIDYGGFLFHHCRNHKSHIASDHRPPPRRHVLRAI